MHTRITAGLAVVLTALVAINPASAAPSRVAAGYRSTLSNMSFISAQDGWLLAQPPNEERALVERTTDGGRSWTVVGRSPFRTAYPCARPCGNHPWAGQIRFADARHGYIFGSSTAMTRDGGRTWIALRRSIVALEPSGNSVVATEHYTDAENDARLVLSHPGSRHFVPAPLDPFSSFTPQLTRQGASVWLTASRDHGANVSTVVQHSTDSGRSWRTTTQPGLLYPIELSDLASAPQSTVWMIYAAGATRRFYLSASITGGRTWARPELPAGLPVTAAPTSRAAGFVVIGRHLLRTTDGGRSWTTSLTFPRNRGFGATITHSDATHVHLMIGHRVYNSADAGRHWTFAAIR